MHVTLNVKHVRWDRSLEELFAREQERIVRRLARVPLELVSLHCEVDGNPHVREAYASLTLTLPAGPLNARGVGGNVLSAVRDAVDDLLVELERARKKNRRDERRPRNGRSDGALEDFLDRLEAEEPTDVSREIRRTLGELYPFVRRELTRHSEVLERPECRSIDVSDVVEEAVLRALSTREQKPSDVPFDRWLFTCAYDVIMREEDALAARGGDVSLDANVDGEAGDGSAGTDEVDLEEESAADTRYFADLLPGANGRATDDEVGGRDLRLALLQAIRHLPGESRKVVSLVALEGLEPRQAAARLRCSEHSVQTAMESARDAVRAELSARGYDTR